MEINGLSGEIINAAMKVHSELGPGMLENAYEACLGYELQQRGYEVKEQVEMPIIYEKIKLDTGYRIDLLIENKIIIELKTVKKIMPVHKAQVLSYLKMGNKKLGLLINFYSKHLKNGIYRIIN